MGGRVFYPWIGSVFARSLSLLCFFLFLSFSSEISGFPFLVFSPLIFLHHLVLFILSSSLLPVYHLFRGKWYAGVILWKEQIRVYNFKDLYACFYPSFLLLFYLSLLSLTAVLSPSSVLVTDTWPVNVGVLLGCMSNWRLYIIINTLDLLSWACAAAVNTDSVWALMSSYLSEEMHNFCQIVAIMVSVSANVHFYPFPPLHQATGITHPYEEVVKWKKRLDPLFK